MAHELLYCANRDEFEKMAWKRASELTEIDTFKRSIVEDKVRNIAKNHETFEGWYRADDLERIADTLPA